MNPFRSWLGRLNFLLLQFLFMRLEQHLDDETEKTVGWAILFPIIPLTGWWNRYWPNWFLRVKLYK